LPSPVLKELGGFSDEFRDYGIDPDLTAKVLFAGYKIVYTKKVAIHHYRNWAVDKKSDEYKKLMEKHKNSLELYENKYARYSNGFKPGKFKPALGTWIKKVAYGKKKLPKGLKDSRFMRDLVNVSNGLYISLFDLLKNMGKKYYLVQAVPKSFNPDKTTNQEN